MNTHLVYSVPWLPCAGSRNRLCKHGGQLHIALVQIRSIKEGQLLPNYCAATAEASLHLRGNTRFWSLLAWSQNYRLQLSPFLPFPLN